MNFTDKVYKRYSDANDMERYSGKIYLNCCVGVEYDLDLLEYSINYYKELGVDEFFIILNTEDENSFNLKRAMKILDKYPDIHRSIWIGEYYGYIKGEKEKSVVEKVMGEDDWIITTDVDEFFDFPIDLRKLIAICEDQECQVVYGKIVDRISSDYKLKKVDKTKSLWEQFPINAKIYNQLKSKILLRRKKIDIYHGGKSGGHHSFVDPMSVKIYPDILKVYHFHWTNTLLGKLEERVEVWKKYGRNDWKSLQEVIDDYKKYGMLVESQKY